MVRRDGAVNSVIAPRYLPPTGASPVSVSAGAPSSGPQARDGSPAARAGCQKSPRRKQARGPQHHVKPAASSDSQSESRAGHVAAKAMSAVSQSGDHAAGLGGVWGAARVHGDERNTRGPSAPPSSRQRDSYKPMAKSSRAQRESEGVVVPMITATNNAEGGKGPYSGLVDRAATCEGMTGRTGSNHPTEYPLSVKARHPQRRLGSRPSDVRTPYPRLCCSRRSDVQWDLRGFRDPRSIRTMRRSESTTGKPCAGNPHARFERGSYPHPAGHQTGDSRIYQ